MVALAPVPTLHPSDALPLRYELCRFAAGTSLSTTVTVRAVAGATGRAAVPLSSTFADVARQPVELRTRRVRLPTLLPGDYQLRVSVRDRRGRERSASTPVRIAW